MLTASPFLTVEITRAGDALLRVVFSRSDRPAQQVTEQPFDAAAVERVASELAARFAASAARETAEEWESGMGRLASRFAAMILPGAVVDCLAARLPVEFVLDDYCMAFPVEALPGDAGPLGMRTPVVRRWLCDTLPPGQKERRGGVEMLIVADPAGSHPAARREGQAVLRFMRGANPDWRIRYLSRQVTCAQIDDELPDTDIFHLAAHMEDEPPGVRAADGAWLPSPESAAPGIVVAACCNAGGLGGSGRELAGRFLRAGTRQVIAPCAAVSDRMGEFFFPRAVRGNCRRTEPRQRGAGGEDGSGTGGAGVYSLWNRDGAAARRPLRATKKRDRKIDRRRGAGAGGLVVSFLLAGTGNAREGCARVVFRGCGGLHHRVRPFRRRNLAGFRQVRRRIRRLERRSGIPGGRRRWRAGGTS